MKARAWLAPIALLGLLALALVAADPARFLTSVAPPVEDLAFDRVLLEPGKITLHVRNVGAADIDIAQVIVDDAYWAFDAQPAATLARFDTATLTLDYPWVETEPVSISLLTASGVKFVHDIDVALESPRAEASQLGGFALLALVIAFLPIVAGMAFFPLLKEAGTRWTHAVLALTLGLLAFLLVDTVVEGLELAEELPGSYHATGLFVGAAVVAVVAVLALGDALERRASAGASASVRGATLAILIAVGIGLHNLGEGLVVGSAFAAGALALGTTLVVGFAVHNITEGPAIVAPLATPGGRLTPARFALLAAIAGLPTVIGAWAGAFATGGVLPVIFFGLGAGAILVVLVQVGVAMRRDEPRLATAPNLVAFAAGYLVMLGTGFLIAG